MIEQIANYPVFNFNQDTQRYDMSGRCIVGTDYKLKRSYIYYLKNITVSITIKFIDVKFKYVYSYIKINRFL